MRIGLRIPDRTCPSASSSRRFDASVSVRQTEGRRDNRSSLPTMAWTLHYQPIRNPRADDALLTLGRALYISNAFEDKCRYALRMINLIEKMSGDPVLKLEEAIAQAPKDKMLDPTLQRLGQLLPAAGEQAEVLAAARRARNYIAHEGGLFSIHSESNAHLCERLEQLRRAVRDLAAGDNVMSWWTFEMDNWKELAPQMLIAAYDGVVDRWVFEPVWNLLSHAAGDGDDVSGDGRWHGGATNERGPL